jgi:hypothetical protein
MAFIRCYLDGSEDTNGVMFGVGGFVGDGDRWDVLQPKWLAALPEGVDYFHATDCFSGSGQFKGVDIPDRVTLLNQLTSYVIEAQLRMICHGLRVPTYRRFAVSKKKKLDPFGQNKYGLCFGRAIGLACESMSDYDAETVSNKCAFFVEQDEFEATAKREFTMLRTRPEIWYRERIGTETYAPKNGSGSIALLQVADFGAFLGLKYVGVCKPGRIDWRPYYYKLRDAGCVFRCSKDKAGKLKAMSKKFQQLKIGDKYRLP